MTPKNKVAYCVNMVSVKFLANTKFGRSASVTRNAIRSTEIPVKIRLFLKIEPKRGLFLFIFGLFTRQI